MRKINQKTKTDELIVGGKARDGEERDRARRDRAGRDGCTSGVGNVAMEVEVY